MFRTAVLRCAWGVMLVGLVSGANTGPITRLTIDPQAEIVPLFDGVDAGTLQVRMVANDAYHAQVFITNASNSAVNVALPKAAVGVHVLPQFNPANSGFFGNPNGNLFGNQNANNQGQNQNGLDGLANLAQSVGGGMGPSVNGVGNAPSGVGNGFPSVPSEWADKMAVNEYVGFAAVPPHKTVQLSMRTVCLNYGRPDPRASLPYQLVSVEKFSSDPVLAELLESYSPRVNQQVMQAAAWHVANGISWEQLAKLPNRSLAATSATVFTPHQVQSAKTLMDGVEQQAKGRAVVTRSVTVRD